MFYQRIVFRGAEILALVRTMFDMTIQQGSYFATYESFYELESIENQWILCDSTMDFHDEVQLLTTLAPSSRRVRSQTKYLNF